MEKYQNIDAFINKIKTNIEHNTVLKDIAMPLHFPNQIDVRRTLELLNTTNDLDLQTKLFSVLSACLMLNTDANFEAIIKSSAVYDKINLVLAKGLPRKALYALNFLSTLLYVDVGHDGPTKQETLALYAKNMTRVSGCLATMSDMFTNCMMYQDTWKALCQCLSAACGASELNQSYCTHLIPACIQRCNQTNIEIFVVLQSLLQNHNRNIELFLNCNGISIFIRDLLHYDKCLQLLITVVQCPAARFLLLQQGQVLNDLRDFLRLYGPGSQIGQKAMIILNHIELRSRESDPQVHQASKENITNIIKNKEDGNNNEQIYDDETGELDDTATLMQNVMKEVFILKQSQFASPQKPASKANMNSLIRSPSTMIINSSRHRFNSEVPITNKWNKTKTLVDQQQRDRLQYDNDKELSFSFLNNDSREHRDHIKPADRSKLFNDHKAEKNITVIKTQTFANTENDLPYFNRTTINEKPTVFNPTDFRPLFSSTPKREQVSNLIDSKTSTRKSSFSTQSQTTLQRTRKVVKRRPLRTPRNSDKNLSNRPLSSRFFSAINESCSTLVKTVTNIFKKNEPSGFSVDRTKTHASRAEASFSFLNYMQKRDAVFNKLLKSKNKDCTDFSLGTESCETCDTQALKKKMARNEQLKQTVKKLKMGINLYGCDFKKISTAMWPRQSYMTPIVLYKLYRKLLLK